MADKDEALDSALPADDGAPAAPAPPRRSMGHRGQDVRDTVAEMTARAHEISLEAGSKMAGAMRDVINAAAGLAEFALESARDLVQYMVRRGQMSQEEGERLLREAEEAQSRRRGSSGPLATGSSPAPTVLAAPAPVTPPGAAAPAAPPPSVLQPPMAEAPVAKKPAVKRANEPAGATASAPAMERPSQPSQTPRKAPASKGSSKARPAKAPPSKAPAGKGASPKPAGKAAPAKRPVAKAAVTKGAAKKVAAKRK